MIKFRTALVLSVLFVLILACAAPAQVHGPSAHGAYVAGPRILAPSSGPTSAGVLGTPDPAYSDESLRLRREAAPTAQEVEHARLNDVASHPGMANGVYTVEDPFTGHVSYRSVDFGSNTSTWNLFAVKGLPQIMMVFHTQSESWQYLRCNSVAILADGEIVAPADSNWDGSVSRVRGMYEYIRIDLTVESATKLSTAEHVQIRICRDVFEFPRDSSLAIGEMIRRLGSAQ